MKDLMQNDKYIEEDISYYAIDGRLTEPSGNEAYNWREMIDCSLSVGRPISEDEAMLFKVK